MVEYEECAECHHSTEYSIEDSDESNNGHDCSICVKNNEHCFEHGMCTIDPDICECCGQENHQ